MREVENGIENMLNAIQAGVLTNSTKLRLEKLEAQQKELEVRIAEEKIARPRLSENQVHQLHQITFGKAGSPAERA